MFDWKTPLNVLVDYFYPKVNGMKYVVDLPEWHITTDDYQNKSGVITKYVTQYNDISVPSDRCKKTYLRKNGKFWFTQYVDVKLVPSVEADVWVCPYCGKKYKRNRRHKTEIVEHLQHEHRVGLSTYLKIHAEDAEFLSFANHTYGLQLADDKTKYVTCAICGKKLARIDWKHLNKHGISQEEYMFKYGQETLSESTREKLRTIVKKVNENIEFQNVSNAEKEIKDFISKNGVDVYDKRKIIDGKELDIFIPSLNLAIEYNGLYYHTEKFKNGSNYHLDKTLTCARNGVKLIQIFEDEYRQHKDLVLSKIGHLIGIDSKKAKVMGRKCQIHSISSDLCADFLVRNHIQGNGSGSVKIGAFFNDLLVGVMIFKETSKGEWELVRSATDVNYCCQGVSGKIFKHFLREYNPSFVKSFADRRWTTDEKNNVYLQLGFSFDGYTRPDYRYVGKIFNNRRRIHKFRMRKQRMLKMDKDGVLNEKMTEHEMALKLGMYRIYDCGLIRYVWRSVV